MTDAQSHPNSNLSQSSGLRRDTSFATFASAWCAGFIAHKEGLRDDGPEDREAFTTAIMDGWRRWCGSRGTPPIYDSMLDRAMVAYCGDKRGAPGQRDAMRVALSAALEAQSHG